VGGLGNLATWHLPGGPVGSPARWAAASNVEVGQIGIEIRAPHATADTAGLPTVVSQGRFEEPVRRC